MLRKLAVVLLTGFLFRVSPFLAGQETTVQSKLLRDMPAEQMQALRESRIQADREIFGQRHENQPPEIVWCLRDTRCLLAVARVTAVAPEPVDQPGVSPNLRVDLDIEQMLRGTSEKTQVYTESRWRPIPSGFRFGHMDTALDREEPKVGNLYLIGYSPPGYGSDGTHIDVGGAIDFSQPGQTQTFVQIQHFLNVEASGDADNFAPFLAGLDDPVPWIRDIAAYRLAESDACHASPACGEVFLAHARELLHSKSAAERFNALEWLRPVVAEARVRKTPSSISNDAFRELIQSATADPNLALGDLAFQYLSEWSFARSTEPGRCLEVVGVIRKTAVWDYAELKGGSINSPLGVSTTCIPPKQSPVE